MGTLFDQQPRNGYHTSREDVTNFIEEVQAIAEKTGQSFENVMEAYKIKEMERRNDLSYANGDIFDEQMAGFGKLLEELNENISRAQPSEN